MSDSDFGFGFALGSVLVLAIAVPCVIAANNSGRTEVHSDAVERGLGDWHVNPKTRDVTFRWKIPLEKTP